MDGRSWTELPKKFDGNRDRNSIKENRVKPFVASRVRLLPTQWHRHIALRGEILGCDADDTLDSVCMDRAYLDDNYRNCRDIERSFANDAEKMQRKFCKKKGQYAKFTLLNANKACCACGGGEIRYLLNTTKPKPPPEQAPVKFIPGGTAYLDPDLCHIVDSTGGIVCSRSTRLQTVTVKSAGIWHEMEPIHVQSDFGWARIMFAPCYSQYEFTVFQKARHMLMPPFTPKRLWDWDSMNAHITMRKGDQYVLQIETIHNPDGYTVSMPGIVKTAFCDDAPVKYEAGFADNATLLDHLRRDTDQHSAAKLGLNIALDLYKVAHIPLLDTAWQKKSSTNWGYIAANESYVPHEWYPGMFSFLVSHQGVSYGSNHIGNWDGVRKDPMEQLPTRPLASEIGRASCRERV